MASRSIMLLSSASVFEKGGKKCQWQGCAVLGFLLAIPFCLFMLFGCAFGIKILEDMFFKSLLAQ